MKDVGGGARRSLFVICSLWLLWPLSCDGRSVSQQAERNFQQQYEKDYQRQKDFLQKQNAEWERQTKKLEKQDARYEVLLAKWEEQSQRVDALIDRWERVLGVLEERSGDR